MAKILLIPNPVENESRIAFWCEGCDALMLVCPNRWSWNGDYDNPTLSPSILQTLGPFPDGHKEVCHCFVRNGHIEHLGDCTHHLRGTRPLLKIENVLNVVTEPDGRIWYTRKK